MTTMPRGRDRAPIARDALPAGGWPIAAARYVHGDRAAPHHAPVTHSHAALGFYTRGRSRIEQRGAWNVGEGDVLLVPAGAPHRLLESRRAELWGLAFCVPCFAAERAASLLEPFERVRDGGAAVVRIPAARHGYLAGLFGELERAGREPRGPSDAQHAVQRSLLTLILAEIERAASTTSAASTAAGARAGEGEAREVRRPAGGGVAIDALRFIERHCLAPLTLEAVAAAVGRSPAHVTTALTRATGRSAVQWIVSGRMAEARRLLLHSDERVEAVAARVGYADATHFIRMFRRAHGATPAAWRAQQRLP